MEERNLRKTRVGIVVSDKMDKTITVAIQDNVRHPLYNKIVKKTYKLKAHDEKNECGVGDRVMIIEDVTTSGKSMEETVPKVRGAANVEIVGLMVSLNRMEKGLGGKVSALEEIKEKYGFDAHAIVTMQDVIDHLYNRPYKGEVYIDDTLKKAIDEYYAVYGA